MRQIYAKLSEVLLATEGALIVRYRGSWISGADFVAGDLVDNSGAWFCIANNTGSAANEPGVGASYTDYWVPLQHVTVAAAQNFTATDTTPYARLVGSGGVYSIEMRLEGGILKFYDNIAGAVIAQMTNADGLVVTKENDHILALEFAQGVSTVGTTGALSNIWTLSEGASDNVQKMVRTATVSDTYLRVPIPLPKRSTASKGSKLKSVTMSYVVSGGVSGDVIQLQILKQLLPLVDGVAATGVVLAGDDDADYDASHNTDAARWAAGTHTLTVTIPTGEQAYAVAGERFAARVRVKDAATANLAFTLTGLEATYAHSEY